jgi:hypothetical protein
MPEPSVRTSDAFGGVSLRGTSDFLAGGIQAGPLGLDRDAPRTTFRNVWTLRSSARFVVASEDRSTSAASGPVEAVREEPSTIASNESNEETTGSASNDTSALELSSQRDTSMIHLAAFNSADDASAPAASTQIASAGDGFVPVSLRSNLSTDRFSSADFSELFATGSAKAGNASPSDVDAETDAAWRAITDGENSMALANVPLPHAKPTLTRVEVCQAISEVAETQHLPAPFLVSLIWQESRFNEHAVSPVGAQGIAQFMPQSAQEFGLENPFEPLKALSASARMLRGLVDQFGNLGLAAAAYNGGSGRVENWLARKGRLPAETRTYVMRITGRTPEHWKAKAKPHVVAKTETSAPCPGMESFAEILNEKARVAIKEAKEKEAKEEAKSKPHHRPKLHHTVVASAKADDTRKSQEKSRDKARDKPRSGSESASRVTSSGGRKTLILAVTSSTKRSSKAAEKSRKRGHDTHVASAN